MGYKTYKPSIRLFLACVYLIERVNAVIVNANDDEQMFSFNHFSNINTIITFNP